jgi:hypothetical protein
MLKTLTAAGVGLTMLAAPAAAQDPAGAALVAAQFDVLTSEMGLTAGARQTGRLAQGASRTVVLQSPGGDVYFVGACDENCRDLDLVVRDSAGREIGRDVELDDTPILVVQGPAAAYSVEVSMADCAGECHWGVAVFR